MRLIKLAKDSGSGHNGCPSVYVAESGEMVVQGDLVDADTLGNLENMLPGEGAVRIKPQVIVDAVEQYRKRVGSESA